MQMVATFVEIVAFDVPLSYLKIKNYISFWDFTFIRYKTKNRTWFFYDVLARSFAPEYVWLLSKLLLCVTLNGGPRRLSGRSKDELSLKFLLTEQFLQFNVSEL